MIKIEIAQDYTIEELQNLSEILSPYGEYLIVENGILFAVMGGMFTVCS